MCVFFFFEGFSVGPTRCLSPSGLSLLDDCRVGVTVTDTLILVVNVFSTEAEGKGANQEAEN